MKTIKLKIDTCVDLPLAIIEDTEDGEGVLEIGERTPEKLAIARDIIKGYNAHIDLFNLLKWIEDRIAHFGDIDTVRDEEIIEKMRNVLSTLE